MEVFVDFGLFELAGVAAAALAARNVRLRRHFRLAMADARAKLGRCVRCMTGTAAGVAASGLALAALGPDTSPLFRIPLVAVFLTFAALALLHAGAILYRVLTRLEASVSEVAGGCNCGRRARARTGGGGPSRTSPRRPSDVPVVAERRRAESPPTIDALDATAAPAAPAGTSPSSGSAPRW